MHLTAEELKGISGIKIVRVGGGAIRGMSLVKLASLGLEELRVNGPVLNLCQVLVNMPSLKRLDVWFSEPESADEILRLKALEAVTLRVHGPMNPMIYDVTSLVSLDMSSDGVHSVEPLVSLPKLRSLVLAVNTSDAISMESFESVVQRLTDLDLRSNRGCMALPNNAFNKASSLRSLSLTLFSLSDHMDLGQSNRSLTRLTVQHCYLINFLTSMDVGTLYLTVLQGAYIWKDVSAYLLSSRHQSSVVSQLKCLELCFDESFAFNADTLECISCLTQLESLKLHGGLIRSGCHFPFHGLQSLTALSNLSELMLSGPSDRVLLNRVFRMSWLTKLDKLTIHTGLDDATQIWMVDAIQSLRKKAPDMQLEIECKSLHSGQKLEGFVYD